MTTHLSESHSIHKTQNPKIMSDIRNMSILEIINKKTELEFQLYEIMSKYTYKYIYSIYDKELEENGVSKTLFVDFQLKLIDITKWSDSKINKGYNKFLKWCNKKYNLQEIHLTELLQDIIILYIKVILNKSNIYIESILETFKFPTFNTFYYKYLKRVSRYFYENPKLITENSNDILNNSSIKKIMTTLINNSLPMKEIVDIIEYKHKANSKTESNTDSKIGSKADSSSNSNIQKHKTRVNLIVDKSNESNNTLPYIPTEEYNLDENVTGKDNQNEKDNKTNTDTNGLRYINIPKIKKNPFFYYKKKINEINENFFD